MFSLIVWYSSSISADLVVGGFRSAAEAHAYAAAHADWSDYTVMPYKHYGRRS